VDSSFHFFHTILCLMLDLFFLCCNQHFSLF
jgi:hypothetical protein